MFGIYKRSRGLSFVRTHRKMQICISSSATIPYGGYCILVYFITCIHDRLFVFVGSSLCALAGFFLFPSLVLWRFLRNKQSTIYLTNRSNWKCVWKLRNTWWPIGYSSLSPHINHGAWDAVRPNWRWQLQWGNKLPLFSLCEVSFLIDISFILSR